MDLEDINNQNRKLIESLYPNETWDTEIVGVYYSKTKKASVKQEIYDKELKMGTLFYEFTGYDVYFTEDINSYLEKNFDFYAGTRKIEAKRITGNIRQIKKQFRYSTKQAQDSFLYIQSDYTATNIYKEFINEASSMKGEFHDKYVYIYIEKDTIWRKWSIGNIKKKAKNKATK